MSLFTAKMCYLKADKNTKLSYTFFASMQPLAFAEMDGTQLNKNHHGRMYALFTYRC